MDAKPTDVKGLTILLGKIHPEVDSCSPNPCCSRVTCILKHPISRSQGCGAAPVITHSRGFNHWPGCPGQGRKDVLLHTNSHHRMLEKPPDPSDPIHQGNRFRRSQRGEEFEVVRLGFSRKDSSSPPTSNELTILCLTSNTLENGA